MTDTPTLARPYNAKLILADGTEFFGHGLGAEGTTAGEVCFNTGMTGYQEVLSDLSYAGQLITFTFPHIGNVGCNSEDLESYVPAARGLIVREDITLPCNFRQETHLDTWLKDHKITGISGVDTRALTRHIRLNGAQAGLIVHVAAGAEFPADERLQAELETVPNLHGLELAESVTCGSPYPWNKTRWSLGKGFGEAAENGPHIVAVDFGEKLNILRSLASRGCKVTVVPARTAAEDIMALNPAGVFLSNGPGDPAATGQYAVPMIQTLLARDVPLFGICLGHQLLSIAMGASTKKMYQGHRGANHPVKDIQTGKVEITSQNHGFVVAHGSLPDDVEVTHTSLFDGTIEGVRHKSKPAFSVQYHPESSPGPHDSQYLFERFLEMIEEQTNGAEAQRSAG